MIKYLDMENASIEIDLKTIKEYEACLLLNYSSFLSLNIKRLTFNIKENDIKQLIELLNTYFKKDNILLIIKVFLTSKKTYKLFNNVIVFNTNKNNIIKSMQNVYNFIDLNNENLELICQLIKNDENVIVNPIVDTLKIADFVNILNLLTKEVNGKDINLDGFLISANLMREHPCNSYLCNGWKCGKKISTLPKVLYIDEKMNVFPHKIIFNKLKIGNVKSTDLDEVLQKYLGSKQYLLFNDICHRVFIKYLTNYPYELMPLTSYIEMEVANEKD